jgi:hypothetical protein
MHRTVVVIASVGSLVALSLPLGPAAGAASAPSPVLTGLEYVTSMSAAGDDLLVAGSIGEGRLQRRILRVRPDGSTTTLLRRRHLFIDAVESAGPGITFAGTRYRRGRVVRSQLLRRAADGSVRLLGRLRAHELRNNPDRREVYGLDGVPRSCGVSRPYRGRVDTEPSGIARLPGGAWAVTDFEGNTVLKVGPGGRVSTIAVLPPQRRFITRADARYLEMDLCAAGHWYRHEAAPTDVELGPGGNLVVTLWPMVPMERGWGDPRGAVYRVDPATGRWHRVALLPGKAYGAAIGPGGRIFVTQGSRDRVSERVGGRWRTVARLEQPDAIEWVGKRLYVSHYVPRQGYAISLVRELR